MSVISGVSVSPRRQRLGLYYRLYQHNIGQADVCAFLRHLLRHLHGPVLVLLDNATIHRGAPLRGLRSRHPRLHVEYFPPYAPELNPDEAVWSLAKRQLANGRPDTRHHLLADVTHALEQIAASSTILRGCIKQSDLPPFLR